MMTTSDLREISNFKIPQKGNIIVLYIQYPKIELICQYYDVRAIAQYNCYIKFFNLQNCKTEISRTYCKLSKQTTCLSEILNKKQEKFKKLKEKNFQIEFTKRRTILFSGKNSIENQTLTAQGYHNSLIF